MSFRRSIIIILTLYVLLFCACDSGKMREYYEEKENYITATGTITHIQYSGSESALYLGFSKDLDPSCDGTDFKIVGKNLSVIQKNPNYGTLEIGTEIQFVTAPKYWGDGYVMPIVAMTVNGEEWLSFDEGHNNFLKWFDEMH